MRTYKNIQSPLALIEQRPNRRTRAESTLRRLMATSYPHALFSNVALSLVKAAGETETPRLFDVAAELRSEEKELSFLDFPRYMELQRQGEVIHLRIKRLVIDPQMDQIKDVRHNHEALCDINIQLDHAEQRLENLHTLVEYLLREFYQVSVPHYNREKSPEHAKWEIQQKDIVQQGASLEDVRFNTVKQTVRYAVVVKSVLDSLTKPFFHISLSTKTLTCHDQDLRVTAA